MALWQSSPAGSPYLTHGNYPLGHRATKKPTEFVAGPRSGTAVVTRRRRFATIFTALPPLRITRWIV